MRMNSGNIPMHNENPGQRNLQSNILEFHYYKAFVGYPRYSSLSTPDGSQTGIHFTLNYFLVFISSPVHVN